MKLLLTSIGWWECPSIGDTLVKMINKKASEVKVLIVITPDKFYQRNKYIIRQIKQFDSLSIPEKNIEFFQLDRTHCKTPLGEKQERLSARNKNS